MLEIRSLTKEQMLDVITNRNARKSYRTNWEDVLRDFYLSNDQCAEVVTDEYTSIASAANTIQQVSNRAFNGDIVATVVGKRMFLTKV